MRVVDANVLLYAVNEDARHHEASRSWLDRALGGADRVGFGVLVQIAFLRLSTSPRAFRSPMSPDDALDLLDDWMSAPGAVALDAGTTHLRLLRELLGPVGVGGNLANDAHIAALAIEHRGEVVSYDRDFDRFSGVRRRTPDDLT